MCVTVTANSERSSSSSVKAVSQSKCRWLVSFGAYVMLYEDVKLLTLCRILRFPSPPCTALFRGLRKGLASLQDPSGLDWQRRL